MTVNIILFVVHCTIKKILKILSASTVYFVLGTAVRYKIAELIKFCSVGVLVCGGSVDHVV